MINKPHGYTLLECLVVIVIVGILLGFALPSFSHLMQRTRVVTQVDQLVATINYARSEAINRHAIVTLCKSADGKTCSGEWRDGWLVFVDKQAQGQVNPGDVILRVHEALHHGDELAWDASSKRDAYLQLDATGATRGQAGTFVYSPGDRNPQNTYRITVSLTGRVRVSPGSSG